MTQPKRRFPAPQDREARAWRHLRRRQRHAESAFQHTPALNAPVETHRHSRGDHRGPAEVAPTNPSIVVWTIPQATGRLI